MNLIVRIKEGQVAIVERQGNYFKTLFPGPLHFLVPVIDELIIFDLKPKTFRLPKFSLLVKGDYTIDLEVSMKYKVMEPYKARYEVENKDLEYTLERYIIKTLSHQLNDKSLEEAVSMQKELSELLKKQLNNISRNWGFKLFFIEIHSMKKSFLAEQEREKLYDVHEGERGTYMSEKVDLKDPAKALHYKEEDQETEIINFNEATSQLAELSSEVKAKVDNHIEELEAQLDEIEDENIKEMNRQQIDIFKQHQEDMLKLQEKDLQQQHDELMFQIQEMSKLQKELITKQNDLISKKKELEEKKQHLQQASKDDMSKLHQEPSATDPLTGLYNKQFFQTEIAKKIQAANEFRFCLSFYMIGIDDFNEIKNQHGQNATCYILKKFAEELKATFKDGGLVSRYSEHMFAVLSQESSVETALAIAEKLREYVETTDYEFNQVTLPVTISAGIALKDASTNLNPEQLTGMATKAYYAAKKEGPNRVVAYNVLL
jgi:diguanylate cyclase (GGDEF)-like protein